MPQDIISIIFAIVVAILIIIGAIIVVMFFSLNLSYSQTGVPFVKSKKSIVKKIKELNILKPNTVFCDLGSGDGAFLYDLAKEFPEVKFVGYEKNFLLHLFAKIFNRLPNLTFYQADFFKIDLSQFDYLYLFLFRSALEKLEPKLKKEAKKGAYIISNSFAFKNLTPIKVLESSKGLETLYIYQL